MRGIFWTIVIFALLILLARAVNAADYGAQYRQQQYSMAVPPITVTAPPQQPQVPLIFTPLLLPFLVVEALFTPVPIGWQNEIGWGQYQYQPQYPQQYGQQYPQPYYPYSEQYE